MSAIAVISREAADVVSVAPSRRVLEAQWLPAYLAEQRWYNAKNKSVSSVLIDTATAVPGNDAASYLVLSVGSDDQEPRQYQFPVWVSWDCPRPALGVVAELRLGASVGWLVDAFTNDDFVRLLFRRMALADGSGMPSSLLYEGSPGLASDPAKDASVRRSGAEQSNTSVVVGRYMLKAFRRLEPGIHPELEVGKYLTNIAGFQNVPQLMGSVSRGNVALCVLQSLIADGVDGWEETLRHLGTIATGAPEDLGRLHALSRQIGKRTAELHRAFAGDTDDPAFTPEAVSREWLEQWRAILSRAADEVCSKLEEGRGHRQPSAAVEQLLARQSELAALIGELVPPDCLAFRTRIHGDLHLGQMLISRDDVFIVDFEGEPLRPLAERRGKYLPLRDVAGVMRSFDYALATTVKSGRPEAAAEDHLGKLVGALKNGFVGEYRQTMEGSPGLPKRLADADRLLQLSLIEKALYEIQYELAHRPDWLDIPVLGLIGLLDGSNEPIFISGNSASRKLDTAR